MAEMNIEQARQNMIAQQIRPWDVSDNVVLDMLAECEREAFVPAALRNLAFIDMELPIGHGEHMMFPRVEARMLQALQVRPTDRILEVGTGSGFVTMLLARLGAHVTSVEIHEDLANSARQRLTQMQVSNAEIHLGDASQGWSQGQPYDVIAITGSLPSLPESFKHDLQNGGRLFAVIGSGPVMEARLITRVNANEWREQVLFETWLAPLQHTVPEKRFSF